MKDVKVIFFDVDDVLWDGLYINRAGNVFAEEL